MCWKNCYFCHNIKILNVIKNVTHNVNNIHTYIKYIHVYVINNIYPEWVVLYTGIVG